MSNVAAETNTAPSLTKALIGMAGTFDAEDRDIYMEAATATGAKRSLARRSWRKVHGSMYA